ncbi:MAG: OB-fold domain-containing protein, partial [Anaerolineae bacterium]
EEWVDVPSTGRVHTFTVVHIDLDGNPLPEPRIVAFVQLDGTDGGLVHFLDEVERDQVCIGMCVEAVFKDQAERKGSITDIAYFKPA